LIKIEKASSQFASPEASRIHPQKFVERLVNTENPGYMKKVYLTINSVIFQIVEENEQLKLENNKKEELIDILLSSE
jgi:hypothetical protein